MAAAKPRAAAAKSAPATTKPKANTGAKVTKAAPAAKSKATEAKKKAAPKVNGAMKTSAKGRGPKKETAATKAMPTTSTTTKAGTKTAATKKAEVKKTTGKRKAEDEKYNVSATGPAKRQKATPAPASVKKPKPLEKGAVINDVPTDRLTVYVFGSGENSELGLGTAKMAKKVKRPRLNPFLAADKVGVVQISAGAMHAAALTHDNKILTWGVNDEGALGRDTTWDGGLKDMDAAEDSDSEDGDDNGLNPKECTPGEVDFSQTEVAAGSRWIQVAAGDSYTLAVTDDGKVYGWGTFRGNQGVFGFTLDTETALRPILIPGLKNITKVSAGSNHALALNKSGSVFAWGSGEQNQLGRRLIERNKLKSSLEPREFGLPKGPKNGIRDIATGTYHSFAISKNGDVYAWGLNNFANTGIPDNAGEDNATVLKPQVIEPLRGKTIVSIKGADHHSLCATQDGDCLAWGRIDGNGLGISSEEIAKLPEDQIIRGARGEPRILKVPTKVSAIQGKVVQVTGTAEHCIALTQEGKAWSWGFSTTYQTGQGTSDDVLVATMIDNTAVHDKKLNGVHAGSQYGVITCVADADVKMANGA